MNITIKDVRSASDDEWDQTWMGCDYATYYHSRHWHNIWKSYLRGKIHPAAKVFEFSDGKQMIFPVSCHRIGFGILRRYLSSPARTYGGPISVEDLTTDHATAFYEFIAKYYQNIIYRMSPFHIPFYLQQNERSATPDTTYVLNLQREFNAIVKSWTKGHRSAVTKARNAGMRIRVGDTEKDWRDYYKIYLSTFSRWGDRATSKYKWNFFKILSDADSQYVKLWIAEYQEKPVAGAVIFYAKRHAVYGYSAALGEFFQLRPVNLIIYEIVNDLHARNYLWFDFNASGGHKGVMNFKKSFGSVEQPCSIIDSQSHAIRILEGLYKKWMVKLS